MTHRDPIIGDLLEEYREVVMPARGRLLASAWFAGQVASLMRPWMWGALLGTALGVLNLVSTAMAPLAEDTPPATIALGIMILGSWGCAGFFAERRRHRFGDAIIAGIVVATMAMALFSAANLARKVVFLETIQYRSDWRGLLVRFYSSGVPDLRTFVIDEHLRGLPGGIAFSIVMGALCGALGGAISSWRREQPSRMDVT